MVVAPSHWTWLTNSGSKGRTNPGSGIRRIEAELVGINRKGQKDWYVLCETTPMTWNHITYDSPTHCYERVKCNSLFPFWSSDADVADAAAQDQQRKFAMWDIPDILC